MKTFGREKRFRCPNGARQTWCWNSQFRAGIDAVQEHGWAELIWPSVVTRRQRRRRNRRRSFARLLAVPEPRPAHQAMGTAPARCSLNSPPGRRSLPASRWSSSSPSPWCGLGDQRAVLRLQRYVAARDQHLDHDRDVPDGVPDPEHAEPRHARFAAQAGGADHRDGWRQEQDRDRRGSLRGGSRAVARDLSQARGARRSIISSASAVMGLKDGLKKAS